MFEIEKCLRHRDQKCNNFPSYIKHNSEKISFYFRLFSIALSLLSVFAMKLKFIGLPFHTGWKKNTQNSLIIKRGNTQIETKKNTSKQTKFFAIIICCICFVSKWFYFRSSLFPFLRFWIGCLQEKYSHKQTHKLLPNTMWCKQTKFNDA